MGRLTKKKIDEIAKLRGEGYTQSEVAQKTGTCLKTVRKYDPGSISGSAKEWRELQNLPERVKKLEEIVKTLSALSLSYQFETYERGEELMCWCPGCDSAVTMNQISLEKGKTSVYRCTECRTEVPTAKYINGPLADVY